MSSPVFPPPSPALDEGGLAAFFRRMQAVNPFLDNRVNGPSAGDVDVAGIHQAAFGRLTELAGEALEARRGIGAVLWGEAGVGKSHLLSRLARWAGQPRGLPDASARALFVYLHNLQAAPAYLPRSLLHAVVSLLTHGKRQNFYPTPLFDLAHGAALEAVNHQGGFITWSRLEQAYGDFLDRLGRPDVPRAALVDRTVYEVLYRFFRSAWRQQEGKEDGSLAELAVRWLAGQALDPVEARFLGLPTGPQRGDPVALADNQQIKQVLVALTRLAAGRGQPFVLAFDQVDNLDEEQAGALARFLEAVIDSSPNLLVVTAGVQNTLFRWKEGGVIQESAWHRLAQFEVLLQRLTTPEALEVVRSRLREFLAPWADLEPLRRQAEDDLFPLGRPWYDRFLRDRIEARPRDVINWAREGWRQQQEALRQEGGEGWLAGWPRAEGGGPTPARTAEPVREAVDRKVDEKIEAHRTQLRRDGLPPDADHLAGLIHAMLVQCRDAGRLYGILEVERLPPPRPGTRPTYDLAVVQPGRRNGQTVRTGVRVLTTTSAQSVTGFLRRLLEDPQPLDRLLLVTEERVGLPLGERGAGYLQDLQQAGPDRFQALELIFDEYAELDALQAVVALARAGDLEVASGPGETRPVTAEEVIDSLHRRGRYRNTRLFRALLGRNAKPAPAGESEVLAP